MRLTYLCCGATIGAGHNLSCPTVSAEQMLAEIDAQHRQRALEKLVGREVEGTAMWRGAATGPDVVGECLFANEYEVEIRDDEGHRWSLDPATVKEID